MTDAQFVVETIDRLLREGKLSSTLEQESENIRNDLDSFYTRRLNASSPLFGSEKESMSDSS